MDSWPISPVFRNIISAEDDYRRGYKDSSEKRKLLLRLTGNDSSFLKSYYLLQSTLPLCHFRKRFPELERACELDSDNPVEALFGKTLPSKYTLPVPIKRTQTPEEALQGSLLLFFTMNKTDFHPITPPDVIPSMLAENVSIWKDHLNEAFCRSVEPFSEVFDTKPRPRVETEEGETWLLDSKRDFDDHINRPTNCWRWAKIDVIYTLYKYSCILLKIFAGCPLRIAHVFTIVTTVPRILGSLASGKNWAPVRAWMDGKCRC